MSLALALTTYLNLNLLLVIGLVALALLRVAVRGRVGAAEELRLHYSVLLVIAELTVLHPFLPRTSVFRPPAKVWSAPSLRSFNESAADHGGYLSVPLPSGASLVRAEDVSLSWCGLAILMLIFGAVFIGRDLRALLRIKRGSFPIKRVGRVRVFLSSAIEVPFSYWLPGQANIVLPESLLARPRDFKIAVAHEIQHHRNADTRWIYGLWFLRLICPLNPAIHIWTKWISELQEFACDETLLDGKRVDSQAYARCLFEVAQSARTRKFEPVCATGLTFLVERNLLHRRIEKMFTVNRHKVSWTVRAAVLAAITMAMGATALASNSLVQDRRVSLAQATAMAARAQSETGFPVVVNDLVLKQLNRLVGTPEGREFMRNALMRMKNYEALVSASSRRYGVPAEILAVPLVESGYQNLSEGESKTTQHGAGIWQFIPSTARHYGLRVDSRRDERLDVPVLTDAAMRYLSANNLRFRDWLLSALAYNMGENAVQKAIEATGSRDAWTLIRSGYEGDKDYIPKLVASILIMKNPDSVQ